MVWRHRFAAMPFGGGLDRLQRRCLRIVHRGGASPVSSVLFGATHGAQWLAGTAAGALYALVYVREGRIGEAVSAHATTNALIAASVLGLGYWNLW